MLVDWEQIDSVVDRINKTDNFRAKWDGYDIIVLEIDNDSYTDPRAIQIHGVWGHAHLVSISSDGTWKFCDSVAKALNESI